MKRLKFVFPFISIVLLVSCSGLKAPDFIGIENIEFEEMIQDSISIKADLKFQNPNRLSGKILLSDLHLVINDSDLGYLKNQSIPVISKNEFLVPLYIKLAYSQIFNRKNGLLSSIFSSVLSNEIDMRFDGKATFKKLLIKKEYPFAFQEKIKILK